MSLSLAGLANNYYQNYIDQQTKATGQNSGTDFNSVFSAKKTDNIGSSQGAKDTSTSNVNAYTEYLKSKYGNVMVQNVGNDQKSMDSIGAGTAGTGNVFIASNILEQMANDPEKAAYYESKIQAHFDSLPQTEAFMAAVGHKITSCGVVVHPDGTVTYYLSGEESPEKKAKVEAEQKAKREKKAAQHKENIERSQEAAEKRKLLIEKDNRERSMAEILNDRILDVDTNGVARVPNSVISAVAAYENAVSTFSVDAIENNN